MDKHRRAGFPLITCSLNTMIAHFRPRQLVLSGIQWLSQISNSPRSMMRFVPLSLPFFRRQLFYDKKLKKFFSVHIRDWVDWTTITQIYYNDDYNLERLKRHQELTSLYASILAAGKTPLIIDCGGNIGLASRYFFDNYSKAQIICIEPDSSNASQARKNNPSATVVLESAIGSTKSRGTIIDPGLGNNAYRISCEGEGNTEIISVNDLLERYDSAVFTPFLIKIDIEGFESELFSKNTEWVEKFPLLIMELHDWMLPKSANSNNFLKTIANADRDFIFYGENVFSVSNTIL